MRDFFQRGDEPADQPRTRRCVIVEEKIIIMGRPGAPIMSQDEVDSFGEVEVSLRREDFDPIIAASGLQPIEGFAQFL